MSAGPSSRTKSPPRYAEVVDAWVKLWAVYNGALTLLTLVALRGALFSPEGLVLVASGALFANICFMTAPAFELALQLIGARETRALRWVLFGLGFLFALFLTLGACLELLSNL